MATRRREFPNNKRTGRSASEPMSSPANELEKPTLRTKEEGHWMVAEITEMVPIDSRGSRVDMF